jgi:Mg2+-importing ATPase
VQEANAWKLPLPGLYSEFSTSAEGLSEEEAHARLRKYGPNAIAEKDRRDWKDILVSQFMSPLLLLLVAAACISAVLGDVFDAAIIVAVVLFSALLGFFQEHKSERVLAELKKFVSHHAIVLRNGDKQQVDAQKLVPGDVVFVATGDIVPADMRVIETSGIMMNEAVLTGESRDVGKATAGAGGSMPQQIRNGIFMGTVVADGHAKCLVVDTGQRTFFGRTAAVFSAKMPETDFQTGIKKFGSMVLRVIVVMTAFVFLANYGLGHGGENPLVGSLTFALALAVGIAPEALPAIMTITLASGSMTLARKKVVTKKLAAIEDLGNMDVLCTDKTGTLTREGIVVESYVDLDKNDSADVFEYAMLCNSAVGTKYVKGNAIDVAIRKHGLARKTSISRFKKVQELAFDFKRRRMGTVVEEHGKRILIVKGAPESVLAACTKIKIGPTFYDVSRKGGEIRKMITEYNRQGLTTIAVAAKDVGRKEKYSDADESGLALLGFILLSNPPKHTALATIARLHSLNVRLKILTGDDPLVTRKVCEDIGLTLAESRVVLGSELEQMGLDELRGVVENYDVFARVTPEQKLSIVEALRANGHVVGFMGDGINDAPALRAADVGISVDTAADVAKGASHIILLQKSLAVVCDGVEEGRKIFGNITKYILVTMSSNSGNMITVALSSLFLPFLPLLPAQILLNNLISDLPMFGISADNVDSSYKRRPQKWDIRMIMHFMLFFGVISTVFDLLLIGIMQLVMHVQPDEFRTAWFLESVLTEIIIIFSLRTHLPFFRSMPSMVLVGGAAGAALLSFIVIVYAPLAAAFHFVPLGAGILGLIAVILAGYFLATELGKAVFFRYVEKETLSAG